MKRTLQVFGLVMTVLLVCSQPAEAGLGWWDWLEDLSGPGPFSSRGNLMATVYCSDSTGSKIDRLFKLPEGPRTGPGETCLFVDQRSFRAEDDLRFHRVDVSITEFGPSVRLHPAVELGAGLGFIHFRSKAPDRDAVTATRVTISFPRLVFMPLQALPFPRFRDNNRWGFLKIYLRETIIVGELDQSDFAAKPATTFSTRNERVRSMGFIIDVTPFLPQ